jgi:hypothetical protein
MAEKQDIGKLKAGDLLSFQLERKFINLYKSFLEIIEDIQFDGYNIPEDRIQRYRKKILDNGNNAIREMYENLEKMNIKLK